MAQAITKVKKTKSSTAAALRFGIVELTIAIIGLVFVRRQVYLSGQFQEMLLHWQEYAMLIMLFADGVIRGAHTYPFVHELADKRRTKFMKFFLPFVFFLFVACSSLCDKLNTACIRSELWRDAGLLILSFGIYLSWSAQKTKPRELLDAMLVGSAQQDDNNGKEETISNSNSGSQSEEKDRELEHSVESPTKLEPPNRDNVSDAVSAKLEMDGTTSGESISSQETGKNSICSSINTTGIWDSLRYPERFAVLVELIGISIALSAWMPLLTIPGLLILFKWELTEIETQRVKALSQSYIDYQQRSWLLIPYVY